MANIKFAVAIVACLVASCVGSAIDISPRITDEHNIDQCSDPTTATVKLLETSIYQAANILLPVTRVINYPETGLNTNEITCLKIINTDTNNHGGYPEIVSGGVGSYDVQIRLTSQWAQPLNFRIEIWADEAA